METLPGYKYIVMIDKMQFRKLLKLGFNALNSYEGQTLYYCSKGWWWEDISRAKLYSTVGAAKNGARRGIESLAGYGWRGTLASEKLLRTVGKVEVSIVKVESSLLDPEPIEIKFK